MSGDLNLEQRYRRVLRLLPGYYRDTWEEDMVSAFLDSWLTGDPDEDSVTMEYDRPTRPEIASVVGLAARLYLGGAGAPRRYFAWGQAVRLAALTVTLVHAGGALDGLVRLVWTHRQLGPLPPPPANILPAPSGGIWPTTGYAVDGAWIVVFLMLVLGHYRAARVLAALAIVPGLTALLQHQLSGGLPAPYGAWAYWALLDLVPVLAMAAFHSGAPPAARRPWLLALPACYLLVYLPVLAIQATGNSAWQPDFPGLCCLLVALACLAHAPRAWSRRSLDSGVWSLALTLLAAVAGVNRVISLNDYLSSPHLVSVSQAELLILLAAVALVGPDAVRAQAATPLRRRIRARMKNDGLLRRTQDMQFQPGKPRSSSALASVLAAAGIVLTVAGCTGHLTPLGPDAAPQPRHLGSPIVLRAMRVQNPTLAGGCPAGFTKLSAPGQSPGCYRPLGAPVTFTSAAVSPGPTVGPASPSDAPPSAYGLLIALPAADRAELTEVTTQAYESQGAVDISAAGKTWALPMQAAPLTHGQFTILLPSRTEAIQLQRLLASSG
jgi:hypothetical protein